VRNPKFGQNKIQLIVYNYKLKHLRHRLNRTVPSPCHFDRMGEISRTNRFLNRRSTPHFEM